MEKFDDNQLVKKLLKGNEKAFAELVNRYSQKVYNLAMRIARNQEDAEEILQDVFVTVYRKIDKFEGKAAFSSWLYRITANTAFMKLRKRKQTPAVSLEETGHHVQQSWLGEQSNLNDVDMISSRHELRHRLEEAIEKLPREYRVIFILRDVDGLSNQEVSDILSLSIPAVKSRLHRSRLMLKKRLTAYYSEFRGNAISPFFNPQANQSGLDLGAGEIAQTLC